MTNSMPSLWSSSDLAIPGKGVRNVVFAATVNNSVYAFDADDPKARAPLWHANYTPPSFRPIRAADMTGACGGDYQDFSGNIGIVGTPVIDRTANTMYFVARSIEAGLAVQRLHAVDIRDGTERPDSPVVIAAAVPGTGPGRSDGMVAVRPASLRTRGRDCCWSMASSTSHGVVTVTGAHIHGWVIGYDAETLTQQVVWNVDAGRFWRRHLAVGTGARIRRNRSLRRCRKRHCRPAPATPPRRETAANPS